MNTSNLTVTLETAKKLKEAGWDRACYFSWVNDSHLIVTDSHGGAGPHTGANYHADVLRPAPTVGELLDALPKRLKLFKFNTMFAAMSGRIKHRLGFIKPTPQEALAELWLRCKKEKLI